METVDTVDYRTPPGQEDKAPETNDVHVVHLTRKKPDLVPDGGGGGGVLAGASAAVSNAMQSAKNAISGSGKDKTKE